MATAKLRPSEPLCSFAEAAFYLDVSPRTIYNLLLRGELVDVRLGARRYVTRDSIKAYADRRAQPVEVANG